MRFPGLLCERSIALLSTLKQFQNSSMCIALADVFFGLLAFNVNIRQRSLKVVLKLLHCSFPQVRKYIGIILYEKILINGEAMGLNDEDAERAATVLSETQWVQPLMVIQSSLLVLYDTFCLSPPASVLKILQQQNPNSVVEKCQQFTYKDFVRTA